MRGRASLRCKTAALHLRGQLRPGSGTRARPRSLACSRALPSSIRSPTYARSSLYLSLSPPSSLSLGMSLRCASSVSSSRARASFLLSAARPLPIYAPARKNFSVARARALSAAGELSTKIGCPFVRGILRCTINRPCCCCRRYKRDRKRERERKKMIPWLPRAEAFCTRCRVCNIRAPSPRAVRTRVSGGRGLCATLATS